MRLELPSGAWAEVPDPDHLTNADRKGLIRAIRDAGIEPPEEGSAIDTTEIFLGPAVNSVMAWLVKEWSYEMPRPAADLEAVDSIPIADYDVLVEHADRLMPMLLPSTEAINSPPGEASGD